MLRRVKVRIHMVIVVPEPYIAMQLISGLHFTIVVGVISQLMWVTAKKTAVAAVRSRQAEGSTNQKAGEDEKVSVMQVRQSQQLHNQTASTSLESKPHSNLMSFVLRK